MTDRVTPYLDFVNATSLEAFSIVWRVANVVGAGSVAAVVCTLKGCSAPTTVELPLQSLTTFDPHALPSLEALGSRAIR